MKKLLCLSLLLLPLSAFAQSTNSNPFLSVLQSTVIDTNSTFWANEKIELRATTQTTLNRFESVLGASYYFGTMPAHSGGSFGAGAEIVNGALNVVDAGYATLEYGYAYYNVKLVGAAGVGYSTVDHAAAWQINGRIEVAMSQNMFGVAEDVWQGDTKFPAGSNTFRIGIGWRF